MCSVYTEILIFIPTFSKCVMKSQFIACAIPQSVNECQKDDASDSDATSGLAGSDRGLSVPVAHCQPASEVLHHGPGWAAFGNDCEWALSMGHYSMDSAEAAG